MTIQDRDKMFRNLKKLIKSSESNYRHGRRYVGQMGLIEAQAIIKDFLGDNL